MVSCVHRKCQTRAGVSGDINKSFECVTLTDINFLIEFLQEWRKENRSGVIRCPLFMVLYLCRMYQCGLLAMLRSHIGILVCLFAAEPRSTSWLLFSSQGLCGMILLALYSMVWDWRVLRARQCFLLAFASCYLFVFCRFPFLFFLWYCGGEVSGLIRCKSLSPSLALQTSFNNDINNNDNDNN